MKTFVIGAMMALALTAEPALADEQREMALATQVVDLAGVKAQVEHGMELVMPIARQQLRAQIPSIDPDEFLELFREEIDRMMPNILSDIARTYVEQFSEDELAQLAAFYQSPVGRALVAKQGTLSDRAAAIGQQYGAQAGITAGTRLLAQKQRPPANP